MPLFQISVLKKQLNDLDKTAVAEAYQKHITHFGNTEIQNNIRELKEEQYQEGFLHELFVNVLGYTLNPQPNHNLTTEYKNEKDAKKADGAILRNGTAIAVIELKGTNTIDLGTVEQQAFNYKNNQAGCTYIITSNFEKLRFYIDNAVEHIEFDLFNLTLERFTLLYLCLHKDNIFNDVPLKLKQQSATQEEAITKKLYSDYSTFKRLLFNNIVELNPQFDKLLLFKKTQKLLDRFLFIFFAEDRLLLPPNSIREIIKQWNHLKELDNYVPLYSRFIKYFGYMHTGYKGAQHDIFAYNGGLFEPDELLDTIKIDDDILATHTQRLSDYDYDSEVDVNILGHIFEHSLNEIEDIQAEIDGVQTEKTKTKRKKDGVFYTPKYITKYIVDNTVGALCSEKKNELQINETEFSNNHKKTKKKELADKLETYRNWLLHLTICDPACGSGAFLNQALNFLIDEHRWIDEQQASLFKDSLVFPDVENNILENNLFGVDINDESVEIAKLSLWLRTAKKGRKLNSLNNNIKCGNSLIDDPTVAGDKAFNWQKEFPDIFKLKNKKTFHVVFAIHNSRYYMITNGFTRRYELEPGFVAYTYPKLDNKEEEILAECLYESTKENKLNIIACNICEDHVHAIVVCPEDELANTMRLLKGRSAFLYNRRVNPSVKDKQPEYADGTKQKFWAKGYYSVEITNDEQMKNTIHYVHNNRIKHGLSIDSTNTSDKRTHNETTSNDTKTSNNTTITDETFITDGLTHQLPQQTNKIEITDGLTRQLPLSHWLQKIISTPEHAFRTEYNDGFDVVIGNPPYVSANNMSFAEREFFNKSNDFKFLCGKWDLYIPFVERSLSFLNINSRLCFIIPFGLLNQPFGEKLRKHILDEFNILSIVDLSDIKVFQDATVPTCIPLISKTPLDNYNVNILKSNNFTIKKVYEIDVEKYQSSDLFMFRTEDLSLFNNILNKLKLKSNNVNLEELFYVSTGAEIHGKEKRNVDGSLISGHSKFDVLSEMYIEGYKEYIEGSAIEKSKQGRYCYPQIDAYLKYDTQIMRSPKFAELFDSEKLIIRGSSGELGILATFDDRKLYTPHKITIIIKKSSLPKSSNDFVLQSDYNLKFLLALINSSFFHFYYTSVFGGFIDVYPSSIKSLPIPKLIIEDQLPFITLADTMLTLNKDLQTLTTKFTTYFAGQYNITKLSNKLEKWYELEFAMFIAELNKAIKTAKGTVTDGLTRQLVKGTALTKKDEIEWMDVFNDYKQKAVALTTQIKTTDKEIDRMVYGLYGLSQEEINIVEGGKE